MENLAIIDLGTGSIRLSVFNSSGQILEVRQNENPCLSPKPGYMEQDTGVWWDKLASSFLDLPPGIRKAIAAIAVTGQREGIVPVNNAFEPLSNLITWLDSRTAEQAGWICEKLGEDQVYSETGLVHNPAWSLSKILWIKQHQPLIYKRTFKFLQAVDYLQSRLSGKACTDVSMASRTCLLNVVKRKWSEKIITMFGIDREKLPHLYEPGEAIGTIDPKAADKFGLDREVIIHAGSGDQQAAAVGAGAFEEGVLSIGIGTSSALSLTLSRPKHIPDGRIILNCAAIPGKWEYEPPIWNTGSLVKWYYEEVDRKDSSYEKMLEDVSRMPAGSDGLIALPYFSGAGSPRWNPDLSGGFFGVRLNHGRVHFLRAIMEAVAFEIRYNLEHILQSGVQVRRVVLSGGASQNSILCQIIADVLQIPVHIFTETEASSWGLYCLIRSRQGENHSLESIHKSLSLTFSRVDPEENVREIYNRIYRSYVKLGDILSKNKFN